MNDLTQRYSRQLILKNWSLEKQQRLAQLTVAVSSQLPGTALYLAAAGIGRLIFRGDTSFSSHIKSLNPSVEILDCEELGSEKIDISVELADAVAKRPHLTTENGSPIKIVVFQSTTSRLYTSAMASSKVISLVHFGRI